jgi:type IV pilus assembly protein PilB
VVFGFGKGRQEVDDDDEEVELVLFQGALNDKEANLGANAKLVQAGLVRTKELISDALSRRAEMIRLEPKANASVATFFVDGTPYPGSRMPAQAGLAITQMTKLLAGLDITVRNKPQVGGIKAEFQEAKYVLRVDVQPIQGGGERLIVRAQNEAVKLFTPDQLGYGDKLKEKIKELCTQHRGVMLAAGPPMSGVSTTAFAIVRGVDPYLYTVYNLVDDLEGREAGHVTTFEKNPNDPFEQTVARAKRAEGDVLFIDPLRDAEKCKQVFELADNVCFVAEMRAKDAASAIVQVSQWLGSPKGTSERLLGVMSQKLIRLICRKCRQAYRPNPKLLAKVGLPPETKVLYRPPVPVEGQDEEEPCEKCGGVGYFGRTGLIEMIEMTDGMKGVVAGGGSVDAIKAQARKEKMQSYQSDGLRLVAEGKTSLEELQRVFKGA